MLWDQDWLWSLPLIVLTTVIHVVALGAVAERAAGMLHRLAHGRGFLLRFSLTVGAITFLATLLLAIEAGLWALTYVGIGALPDIRSATLYSVSAITSYGNNHVYLEPHWRLMGALEALNGIILFGLTTAFFFDAIQSARGRH